MADLTLSGSCFFLGQSSDNGAGSAGSSLHMNKARVFGITMLTDPSSVSGQP